MGQRGISKVPAGPHEPERSEPAAASDFIARKMENLRQSSERGHARASGLFQPRNPMKSVMLYGVVSLLLPP